MGSANSRMGVRSPRPRSDNRPKLGLASFLCGGGSSSSSAPPQRENEASENLMVPGRVHDSVANDNYSIKESSLNVSSENNASSSANDHLRSNLSINDGFTCSTLSTDAITSHSGKPFFESKELVPSVASTCSGSDITHSKRTCDSANSSSKLDNLDPLLTVTATSVIPVMVVDDSMMDSVSHTSSMRLSSSVSQLEPGEAPSGITSATEQPLDEVLGIHNVCPNPASDASTSSLNLVGDEPLRATSSSTDLLTLGETSVNALHVDVVSISSNVLPSGSAAIRNSEARRNSRRVFWDAFSRHTTRRNYDSPAIFSSTEDNDDQGSHDRLLVDIGDDLFGSRYDNDSLYLHRRSRGTSGRRWHSRSEIIRERLLGGFDSDSRRTTFCPSGLHPDGTCSCDSLVVAEESSTRASIARIVLLAEALFEVGPESQNLTSLTIYEAQTLNIHIQVLDEIHRQPVPLSLSMVSLPAPESVVNSLPVKSHTKDDAADIVDDVEQCYICLAEYEEADKIRVLPCRHEYHMACVDKWLTEIHGVCPLCRRDVCEDATEVTVSEL